MMAKGYPKKVFTQITAPANKEYQFIALDIIPKDEIWSICQVDVNASAGTVVSDFTVNDNPIGMYVDGTFGSFNAISVYGVPVEVSGSALGVRATNTGAEDKNITMSLYVYVQKVRAGV